MTAKTITDFAPDPTGDHATAWDAMRHHYVRAAWHSARLDAPADMPQAERFAAINAAAGSYGIAYLLDVMSTHLTDAIVDNAVRHLAQVAEAGEISEWACAGLADLSGIDPGEVVTAAQASVPAGPSLIRSEVEGLRAAAAELRDRAASAPSGETDGDRLWRLGILVDADWLDARADRVAQGGASDE